MPPSGAPGALARNSHYYEKARAFGRIVAQYSEGKEPRDMLFICTGGGPGIMQAANRGAHEGDGLSVGLAIALPMEEAANPYVTPALSFKFHYFALRKMHFMMRAKALVAFPGGFGTLDELFEVITLVQTRKAKQVPIVLFGSAYWKKLINFDVLIEEGVISPADLKPVPIRRRPADGLGRHPALLLAVTGRAPACRFSRYAIRPRCRAPGDHAAHHPEHARDTDQRTGAPNSIGMPRSTR
jgi:uncharacterized protein (TIGR00730 family)